MGAQQTRRRVQRRLVRRGHVVGLAVLMVLGGFARASQSVNASVRVASTNDPQSAIGRIAAGADHTCAITNDNAVWCWGSNASRQLGVSAASVSTWTSAPVRSMALPNARIPVEVVAGSHHTCVRASDGTVWCWGVNGFGQLGNGGGGTSAIPQQAQLPALAAHLAAGGASTCAVLVDDSLHCWGANDVGQVGIGSTVSPQTTPQHIAMVPSTFAVRDIDIGDVHVCAASITGAMWCWGLAADGRLGSSSQSDAWLPRSTASLGGAASVVAAGQAHSCVVLQTSTLKCFGSNSSGQLGQNISTTSNDTPTAVVFGENVDAVSAGSDFTCGLSSTGSVKCFGSNHKGQLANGTTSFTPRPEAQGVTGVGVDRVVALVAGDLHACAVISTGAVMCWGSNEYGQVGVDTSRAPQMSAATVGVLNVVPTTTLAPTVHSMPTPDPTPAPSDPSSTPESPSPSTSVPTSAGNSTEPTATTSTSLTARDVGMPSQTSSTKKVLVRPLSVRRGQLISAKTIASAVSMAVPKTSKGSMRIAITSGGSRCVFRGSAIVGVRAGKCTVAVTLMPKAGKNTTRRTTISVR